MNGRDASAYAYPERGLSGRVVHQLGARIVGGEVPPGELLSNEDDLGAELGVSRSVLREAIKVLAGKGLLEVRPKTGTRVRPRRSWHLLDPDVVRWQFEQLRRDDDLTELAEVRRAVEPAAARLAAHRRTDGDLADLEAHCKRMEAATAEPIRFRAAELDFLGSVVDASHNTMLSHMGAVIRVALDSAFSDLPATDQRSTVVHRAVLDAIRLRDQAGADRAMRRLVD